MAITVVDTVARVSALCRPVNDGTTTTASFTPPNNSLLVICVSYDADGAGATTFNFLGGSLTYTERAKADGTTHNQATVSAIWTAPVTTGVSMTVRAGVSTTTHSDYTWLSQKVYIVTGQHASPIGASAVGYTTTDPTNASLTATGDGRLFGVVGDWDPGTTALTTSTDVEESVNLAGATGVTYTSAYKAADHTAGSQSINFDFASVPPSANWALLEILTTGGAPAAPDRDVPGRRIYVLP